MAVADPPALRAADRALLPRPRNGRAPAAAASPPHLSAVSFSSAVVDAVRNAAGGMLSICAFVVLFSVLAAPLRLARAGPALTGLLELFSLTPLLSSDRFGFLLAAGCAGWGGCSVLCQTAAVLADTDLSLRPCLLGKLLQGLFSFCWQRPSGSGFFDSPFAGKIPLRFENREGFFDKILQFVLDYRCPLS